MVAFLTNTCYGCGAEVEEEVGRYYCDTCVEKQEKEHRETMKAFDEYHRWADSIARKND